MGTRGEVAAEPRKKLGTILLEEGVLDRHTLATALRLQGEREPRPRLGTLLLEMRVITEETLTLALARHFGVSYVDLDAKELDPALADVVPRSYAAKIHAVPFDVDENGKVLLAMEDPGDVLSIDDLGMLSGYDLEVYAALPSACRRAVHRLYEGTRSEAFDPRERTERLWNAVLRDALRQGARSLRVEPRGTHQARVTMLVGNGWREVVRGEERLAPHLAEHLFAVARWSARDELTGARRGFVQQHVGATEFTARIETLPTLRGDMLNLRILRDEAACPSLPDLSLEEGTRADLHASLREPVGLILLAGAARPARLELFAACLKECSRAGRSIVALEEAPDFVLPDVHQIPLADNPLETWRAALRQEPEVLAIDSVRERDLALEALQATLDGRLVIASTPAVDAAHALARWIEWGVPPERLARSLSMALGVVPVRRLCPTCSRPESTPPLEEARRLGLALPLEGQWRAPAGCPECDGTGYRGHVLLADGIGGDALLEAFAERAGLASVDPATARTRDPWIDGVRRVAEGLTTVHELRCALAAS